MDDPRIAVLKKEVGHGHDIWARNVIAALDAADPSRGPIPESAVEAAAHLDLSARVAALEAGLRYTGDKERILRYVAAHLGFVNQPDWHLTREAADVAFPETPDDR